MKIELEKLNSKFAKNIAAALNNSKIRENLRDLPYPYTEENAHEFINYTLNCSNEFVYAIVLDDEFAGCISACRQQNIHFRTAEIGYYVVPEFWNRGVATTALKLLINDIFENTDIIPLIRRTVCKEYSFMSGSGKG